MFYIKFLFVSDYLLKNPSSESILLDGQKLRYTHLQGKHFTSLARFLAPDFFSFFFDVQALVELSELMLPYKTLYNIPGQL